MRNKRGKSSFFRKLKNNQRKYELLLTNSENFNSTILEMKITRFQETLEMFRIEILAGKNSLWKRSIELKSPNFQDENSPKLSIFRKQVQTPRVIIISQVKVNFPELPNSNLLFILIKLKHLKHLICRWWNSHSSIAWSIRLFSRGIFVSQSLASSGRNLEREERVFPCWVRGTSRGRVHPTPQG